MPHNGRVNIKRSTEQPDGSGNIEYSIRFHPSDAPPEFTDTMDALMDAIELHARKALDYDGMENEFGVKGELLGISRKYRKLKKILWDGKDPLFEDAQEMTMDLIGNAALMLRMLKKTSDKYSATWRDNHQNKPTFGPGPQPISWDAIQGECRKSEDGLHHFIGRPSACAMCGAALYGPPS